MALGNSDSRFRSFAERYVIERARNWPADGTERTRAWEAMMDAKSIYAQIAQVDKAGDLDGIGQAGQSFTSGPITAKPQTSPAPAWPTVAPTKAPNPVNPPAAMSWLGVPMANVGEGDWLHQGKEAMQSAIGACIKAGISPPTPLRRAYSTTVGQPDKPAKKWWWS